MTVFFCPHDGCCTFAHGVLAAEPFDGGGYSALPGCVSARPATPCGGWRWQ